MAGKVPVPVVHTQQFEVVLLVKRHGIVGALAWMHATRRDVEPKAGVGVDALLEIGDADHNVIDARKHRFLSMLGTVLSDGGDTVRDLQSYLNPQAEHLLNRFHVTMRLIVLQQTARWCICNERIIADPDISWSFRQLREFIAYKAQRLGVPVVFVDPRNTSRTCSRCGFVDKRNRRSQAEFSCIRCGYESHADTNAARTLATRALVTAPNLCAPLQGQLACAQ